MRASVPSRMGVVITICPAQAVAGHQVAADEEVEELVGAPELDVALEGDRVVPLEQRVEELVLVDGAPSSKRAREVVALEHARDRVLGHELDDLDGRQLVEPLAVAAHLDASRVEDLEGLRGYVSAAALDLVAREARAALVLPRWGRRPSR